MNTLEEFATWFHLNQTQLGSIPCKVEVTWNSMEVDKRSIRADIDTDRVIARVTAWETGECEKAALDAVTGKRIFDEYTICETPDQLHAFLETFMKEISDLC